MANELEELRQIVEEKRRRYEVLGAQNTYGLDTEKRIMLDIDYRQAQNEFNQAMSNYYNALQYHTAQNRIGGFNDTH